MTKTLALVCLILALISASVYFLMASGIIIPADLGTAGTLPAYFYIIPAGYVIGGLLILLKKRWLWITGAVINAFTIAIFYSMYSNKAGVMFSPAGLIKKISQILMEIGLIYLILTHKPAVIASSTK